MYLTGKTCPTYWPLQPLQASEKPLAILDSSGSLLLKNRNSITWPETLKISIFLRSTANGLLRNQRVPPDAKSWPWRTKYWLLLTSVKKFTLHCTSVRCCGGRPQPSLGLYKAGICTGRQKPKYQRQNVRRCFGSCMSPETPLQLYVRVKFMTTKFNRTCRSQSIWIKFGSRGGQCGQSSAALGGCSLLLFSSHNLVQTLPMVLVSASTSGWTGLNSHILPTLRSR